MAKIFFDAATNGNPGESCCAIIIKDDNNHHIYTHYIGLLDNHSAEWAAFIRALEYARELNVTNALLYTDSKLIEDAMLKDKVKNIKFKPYLDQVKILEPSFDLLFVKWIPREQNKQANHHAKQALYQYIKNKD